MDRVIHTGFSGDVIGKKSVLGIRKSWPQGPKAASRFTCLWDRSDARLLDPERGRLGGAGRDQTWHGFQITCGLWSLIQVPFKAKGWSFAGGMGAGIHYWRETLRDSTPPCFT